MEPWHARTWKAKATLNPDEDVAWLLSGSHEIADAGLEYYYDLPYTVVGITFQGDRRNSHIRAATLSIQNRVLTFNRQDSGAFEALGRLLASTSLTEGSSADASGAPPRPLAFAGWRMADIALRLASQGLDIGVEGGGSIVAMPLVISACIDLSMNAPSGMCSVDVIDERGNIDPAREEEGCEQFNNGVQAAHRIKHLAQSEDGKGDAYDGLDVTRDSQKGDDNLTFWPTVVHGMEFSEGLPPLSELEIEPVLSALACERLGKIRLLKAMDLAVGLDAHADPTLVRGCVFSVSALSTHMCTRLMEVIQQAAPLADSDSAHVVNFRDMRTYSKNTANGGTMISLQDFKQRIREGAQVFARIDRSLTELGYGNWLGRSDVVAQHPELLHSSPVVLRGVANDVKGRTAVVSWDSPDVWADRRLVRREHAGLLSKESAQFLAAALVQAARTSGTVKLFTQDADPFDSIVVNSADTVRRIVCAVSPVSGQGGGVVGMDEDDAATASTALHAAGAWEGLIPLALSLMLLQPHPSVPVPLSMPVEAAFAQHCSRLNASQKDAVRAALSNKLVGIRGPPGTGKTHTISALGAVVSQMDGVMVVVTPSNAAALRVLQTSVDLGYAHACLIVSKDFFYEWHQDSYLGNLAEYVVTPLKREASLPGVRKDVVPTCKWTAFADGIESSPAPTVVILTHSMLSLLTEPVPVGKKEEGAGVMRPPSGRRLSLAGAGAAARRGSVGGGSSLIPKTMRRGSDAWCGHSA